MVEELFNKEKIVKDKNDSVVYRIINHRKLLFIAAGSCILILFIVFIYVSLNLFVKTGCCKYPDTFIDCKKLGTFNYLCLCKTENDVGFDEENNLVIIKDKYYANDCGFGRKPITLQEMINNAKQRI